MPKRKFDGTDVRQKSLFNFIGTPTKKPKSSEDNKENTPVKNGNNPKCSNDVTSTPKKPDERKFKPEWKPVYPFIRYDSTNHVMFCTDCESAGRNNIWTMGCDKMKLDAIKKHAKTADHRFAVSARESNGTIEQAAIKAAEKERTGVEGLMKNLYYLAQRNEPSSAISDLNQLLVHHSVSQFIPLQKPNKSLPYEHHESVKEMQEAMSEVVRQELLDEIRASTIFSLMADESTDVSTEKTLVIYVRYEKCGTSRTKFLEVTELSGDECTAKYICEAIFKVLENNRLNVENISCITTDGASVMTGVRGGVTTLMKERNGQMLSIHCIAHRLALASGQAADKLPYLRKYQAMLNTIFKYYHYSPKHQSKLSKIQDIFDMAQTKLKQTFHTRWLSFDGAVDSVIRNYDALITCLEMDVAQDDDPDFKIFLGGILTTPLAGGGQPPPALSPSRRWVNFGYYFFFLSANLALVPGVGLWDLYSPANREPL